MRFILVEVVQDRFPGLHQWRATCAMVDKTVDVFFFADSQMQAKSHVLAKYPSATFSDEVLQ